MADLKTLLFTDILSSVALKSELPGSSVIERDESFIQLILTPHRKRIEHELALRGGRVVSTAGDGHFVVFSDAVSAAQWAVGVQQLHRDDPILAPNGHAVQVRISMHLGSPQIDPNNSDNFIGKAVDIAARLNDHANGRQILVSSSLVAVLQDAGITGTSFHRHGKFELKGNGTAEVWELVYDDDCPHALRTLSSSGLAPNWTVLPPKVPLTEWREGGSGTGVKRPGTSVLPVAIGLSHLSRLGNYELIERLGSGGMGEVYKARHTQFNRLRAIKVIRQSFIDAGDQHLVERFYHEIKAVGKLDHPNVVVAIESSSPDEAMHYLVMEYVDGISLDVLAADNSTLTVADVCEIGRQAARGLEYIYENGMVHRDIKPSNLMLSITKADRLAIDTDPRTSSTDIAVLKILDLGLALLSEDEQQRLTRSGQGAMGTAMYMSPEQFKTPNVDIRSDIYSLGCTLYHLLAGKPPFWASDLKPEKAHEREPLLRDPIDWVPVELWEILVRMTAKSRDERFSTPADVVAALGPLAQQHDLERIVKEHQRDRTRGRYSRSLKADTQVTKTSNSDTRVRTPSPYAKAPSTFQKQRAWRSVLTLLGAMIVCGMAAYLWYQPGDQRLREDRLRSAAGESAKNMRYEINQRFATLAGIVSARDSRLDLPNHLVKIAQAQDGPTRDALIDALWLWLSKKREDDTACWNVFDRQGNQLVRIPVGQEKTMGKNFAYRDYFHGLGEDLAEGSRKEPIVEPHLSAAIRSKADYKLRVAFCAPIKLDEEVVGVITICVDLGDFRVLDRDLPEGCEVVLISLRPEVIDQSKARGLVLHHGHAGRGDVESIATDARWISPRLLEKLDALNSDLVPNTGRPLIMSAYNDANITRGDTFHGAVQKVTLRREGAEVDTNWIVLVQETQ